MRKIQFVNSEYYHIYNRGVDKRDVFLDEKDFWKFKGSLSEFNNNSYYEERLQALASYSRKKLKDCQFNDFKELRSFLDEQENIVDIISYCLIPNHFHLILKQLKDKGISDFMHKIGTSFTNHFNKKYERSGYIFQGPFKAIHIDNNNYLLWLTGYINGNIEIHKQGRAENYKWSSFKELRSLQQWSKHKERSSLLGDTSIVLSQFKNPRDFQQFVKQVIKESRTKKEMGKYLLE